MPETFSLQNMDRDNENKWKNNIIKNKSEYKNKSNVTQWQTDFDNKFLNTFIK